MSDNTNIFFLDDQIKLMRALNQFEVDFLIIGGFAVNYYGYNRSTGDLDIWFPSTKENWQRLLTALDSISFLIDPTKYSSLDDFILLRFGIRPAQIDILNRIKGLDFENAFSKKKILIQNGVSYPFIDIDDLIVSKFMSRRLKDLADIEVLQKITQKPI